VIPGRELAAALRVTAVLALLTGAVYPLTMTGVASALFRHGADGGLLTDARGTVVGAHLIGQSFYRTATDRQGTVHFQTTTDHAGDVHFVIDPHWFQARPPAGTAVDGDGNTVPAYTPSSSGGGNAGPGNPGLLARVTATIEDFRANGVTGDLPVDLVTADFTGFDPDISEASALVQIPMVATARRVDPAALRRLVEAHVEGRALGIFGEPHVNVLDLDRALTTPASR
jgi:potassium-transporting ATPase KdpC subunit